jgi:hypothetical protein
MNEERINSFEEVEVEEVGNPKKEALIKGGSVILLNQVMDYCQSVRFVNQHYQKIEYLVNGVEKIARKVRTGVREIFKR